MSSKDFLRSTLNFLRLDLTKNLEYDRLTKKIMRRVIKQNSNCIDIGCHKGEILDSILRLSPHGNHYGFEPIPELYEQLKANYSNKATILPYALSDREGTSTFQHVKNAPAYSGIQKREYAISNPDIQEIEVELKPLDTILPENIKVDFIKIDVEGGEFDVLKGAKKTLKASSPVVIFECGMGASEFYGTKPNELFDFLTQEIGLKVSLLKSFINKKPALSKESFVQLYKENKEYYFVAYP